MVLMRCAAPVRSMISMCGKMLSAMKRHEHHPERIERGDKNTRQHAEVRKAAARQLGQLYCFNDCVLGKKPGQTRNASACYGTDHHRGISDWHIFAKPAHFSHVLLVM